MDVDAKRIEAVFRAAVQAPNPVERTAILDRECASDAELRQCVEALLRAHQEQDTIVDQPNATSFEFAPPSREFTMAFDPSADPKVPIQETHKQNSFTRHEELKDDEEPLALEFLEPSSEPGSLGRLGHHEVMEVLGRGGFGIVVRAFDESLHRMVAIKVLNPRLASTSPARKRFLREARASARIRHGNVVQIYAVEERPLPYLVMEYIPGQTLQQKHEQTGPLEVADVLHIGAQIARGLAAAHEEGLIHRDIKPGNIMLESGTEQNVKITDFGLARAADDASLTQSGAIAGTPLYMAPEQAKDGPLDPRADLFSLGSVLYTMASGRPPFRAPSPLAVLKRVAEDTPRPIRQIIPEVPQWLCDLIARLHAKDPAHRFQSAAEVAALLEQHLALLQGQSLSARPKSAKVPRRPKPRWVAALAAVAIVLGGLGAVIGLFPWRSARPISVPPVPQPDGFGNGGGQEKTTDAAPVATSAAPQSAHSAPMRPQVLQGPGYVSDALIKFDEPGRSFGAEARDNAVRRADQCNAFLVRFDLAKLELPPKARVAKATVRFYVWDPSAAGKTKVCAFPLKTEWDEATVTWQEPAAGKSWQGGKEFAFGFDTGPAGREVVVQPENGKDTADPPIEYKLDVTDLVQSWLEGGVPNHGLAIAPVIDPIIDEGYQSRFQIYGSEYNQEQYTPKLTVQVQH
jgi:serine/threonine protein kinase